MAVEEVADGFSVEATFFAGSAAASALALAPLVVVEAAVSLGQLDSEVGAAAEAVVFVLAGEVADGFSVFAVVDDVPVVAVLFSGEAGFAVVSVFAVAVFGGLSLAGGVLEAESLVARDFGAGAGVDRGLDAAIGFSAGLEAGVAVDSAVLPSRGRSPGARAFRNCRRLARSSSGAAAEDGASVWPSKLRVASRAAQKRGIRNGNLARGRSIIRLGSACL